MYKIKQKPEDFIVEEIMEMPKDKGKFSYFLLTKKNKNTHEAIRFLSKKFNVDVKKISFSGLKDKNAVTFQYISIFDLEKKYKVDFEFIDIKIKYIGDFSKAIYRGAHSENRFKIIVRDIKEEFTKVDFVENYFDVQRFSKDNISVGRALIKKDFKLACRILKIEDINPISSLRENYGKEIKFFFNAYQSYLFNLALYDFISLHKKVKKVKDGEFNFAFIYAKIKNFKIDLLNFDTSKNGAKIYSNILNKEGIKISDFLIRQIPEIVSGGDKREAYVNVTWEGFEYIQDEINKGKLKAELIFRLPKGSYATMVVRKIFS